MILLLLACTPEPTTEGCAACGGEGRVDTFPETTRDHVAEPIDYSDTPPTNGDHSACWTSWGAHPEEVPDEQWVHNLEHGGVVFLHHCPDGCDDEVAQVQALIDALPVDSLCEGQGVARRVVLTPDPLLDARWGLSAWGHTLSADCVDADRFTQFYLNHFGLGPEKLCNPGSDFGGVPPCQ